MLVIAILIIIGLGIQAFRLKAQRDNKHFLACRYKELCIYAVENSTNKHSILDYYAGCVEDENLPPFCKALFLDEAVNNVLNRFKEDLLDEEGLNIHNYSVD